MKKLSGFARRTVYYRFRKIIKWMRLHRIYLNISDPLVSEKACKAIIDGIYEEVENRVLVKTFTEGDVLLELGTGLGYNSIFCAKVNGGKVVSFEGNRNLLPLIRKNMDKNGVDFDVRNQILLSGNIQDKEISFNIAEEFWSSSAMAGAGGKVMETVSVPTANIAAILKEWQPTYLMVDIEGGEEDFFRESDFLKASTIRKILLELHPDAIGEMKCREIIDNIRSQGFSLGESEIPSQVVYFCR